MMVGDSHTTRNSATPKSSNTCSQRRAGVKARKNTRTATPVERYPVRPHDNCVLHTNASSAIAAQNHWFRDGTLDKARYSALSISSVINAPCVM